jgi:hypothetical protein
MIRKRASLLLYTYIDCLVSFFFWKLEGKLNFTLEQVIKVHRGRRGTAVIVFNLGTRWDGWLTPCPGRFTPKNNLVHLAQEAG